MQFKSKTSLLLDEIISEALKLSESKEEKDLKESEKEEPEEGVKQSEEGKSEKNDKDDLKQGEDDSVTKRLDKLEAEHAEILTKLEVVLSKLKGE